MLRSAPAPKPPVPAEAPLAMPAQDFGRWQGPRRAAPSLRTRLARLVTFGGAAALTAYACREMVAVVSVGGITALQAVLIVLFTLAFAWIALSASAAVAGVLLGGGRPRGRAGSEAGTRTALVMPVCNEDPAASFAALEAMAATLAERQAAGCFEIFVLSDTHRPDIWLRETAAFQALREAVGEHVHIWYRRRDDNVGRKAGNLHEFVTRWGGRYDFMVVLDADSVMAPETLLALVREMAADPKLGLLQTNPRLCGGTTLLARLQQFAGAAYGPIVARGIAAWQGDDGNYWGHNAIVRVAAFAGAAGLPELPGRKPFGGTILSHDFVEAALLRRAGWSVRMLPALGGSFEDSPPTLLDVAARDRRWAQGNVQHLAVIGARGFAWPTRAHLAIGVMSYLASPLWLALIAVGLALTAQVATEQLRYFPDEMTLFPRWPVFDSERMLALFVLAMGTLMLPKVLGLLRALTSLELLRTIGPVRLVAGAAFETILSALYAPISMLMQSRQVGEILRGADSGWSVQRRHGGGTPWRTLLARHWLHTALGVGVAGGLGFVAWPVAAWMAPTLLGLALALPLSAASGSERLARLTRRLGLLVTSEEVRAPDVVARREAAATRLVATLDGAVLEEVLGDERVRQRHVAALAARPPAPRGRPDVARLAARAKLDEAHDSAEAWRWLTTAEQLAVLGDVELLGALVALHGGEPERPRPALRLA